MDEEELREELREQERLELARRQEDRLRQERLEDRLDRTENVARADRRRADTEERRWERLENRAPAAGTGFTGAVGAGMRNFGAGIQGAAGALHDNKLRVFLLLVVVVHALDLFNGYTHVGRAWVSWAMVYLVVAIVAAWLLDDGNGFVETVLSRRMAVFVLVSAVAFFLPILISKLPVAVQENNWFQFLVIMAAPWFAFIVFSNRHDSFVDMVRRVWLIIFIAVGLGLLFRLVSGLNPPSELQGQYVIDPLSVFRETWDSVSSGFKKAFSSIVGVPASFSSFVNRNVNDSIGRSYMGDVDPYADQDLGVRFTSIETFRDEFRTGEPITAWAYMQGESFGDEIDLVIRCFAEDGEGRIFNGTARTQGDEQDRVRLRMREKVSASCEFDSLPKGYYDIWFAGAFVFETWGYVQYYFAPSELVTNMWAQGLDPASEAGIEARPISIYTGGPIMLGLASEYDQPIPVEAAPLSGSPDRTLPPFGASVINQWADGTVRNVRHISLLVPEPFILKDCDRVPVDGSRQRPSGVSGRMAGYREYEFSSIGDANRGFQSVMCYLGFESPQERSAQSIIGSYDLVVKTFAAKTDYVYEIRDSERVRVS